MQGWETIIGLEIHVELNTKSKLFSSAPNRFGDEPNTNITEVCTGQPGSLPVLNKEAVRKAVQFGCAVNATVAKSSKFDRKSYFYPDSPRNFQITQFDEPIVIGGTVIAEVDGEEQAPSPWIGPIWKTMQACLSTFPTLLGLTITALECLSSKLSLTPCIHTPKEACLCHGYESHYALSRCL